MRSFLVETYLSRSRSAELSSIANRLRDAAHEVAADGVAIRYVRSTFVPEDETCFHLFGANSAERVTEAAARAELGDVRVVEAIDEEGCKSLAHPHTRGEKAEDES